MAAEASAHAVSNSISLPRVPRPPRCSARTAAEYTRLAIGGRTRAALTYTLIFSTGKDRAALLLPPPFLPYRLARTHVLLLLQEDDCHGERHRPVGASVSTTAFGTAACAPEKARGSGRRATSVYSKRRRRVA